MDFIPGIKMDFKLPDKRQFLELFNTAGWNRYYKLSENDLYLALQNSWFIISAYQKERLIGFGRIISDGIAHALILDMIVHPEYQKRGIGSQILEIMVAKCKQHQIRDIQLFSAKDKPGFYLKHGFKIRPENAPGMEIKNLPK